MGTKDDHAASQVRDGKNLSLIRENNIR